jgi:uncharacterized protein YndB with AHSA1/START domain
VTKARVLTGLLWFVVAIASVVVLIVVIGAFLPKEHVVTRTLETRQSVEAVWEAISDFGAQPTWWKDVREVTRVEDRDGHDVWREVHDQMTLTMETIEADPPVRLVRRIVDEDLGFGGEWEYVLTPTPSGSRLTVTEHGTVSNPVFRFMGRFVVSQTATIDAYLTALAAHFNEEAQISCRDYGAAAIASRA